MAIPTLYIDLQGRACRYEYFSIFDVQAEVGHTSGVVIYARVGGLLWQLG